MEKSSYREITFPAVLLGVLLGILMCACFTYSGLILGFTTPGSAIAAIVGWGVLRGILRRGTIVENNVNQTIASGLTMTGAGMIFTIPVLYLMGTHHSTVQIVLAAVAGAFLGVVVIVPFRKQMIDIDRLTFPSGTAVAAIIKSPAAGIRKSLILLAGFVIGGAIHLSTQLASLGGENLLPERIDPGPALGLPPYVGTVVTISMFSLAAGYITGRNGLVVLSGGALASWIVPPLLVALGWIPQGIDARELLPYLRREVNAHTGVGMLLGGALTGVVLAFPILKIAFSRIARPQVSQAAEEVSPKLLGYLFVLAFALLSFITISVSELPWVTSLLISVVGMAWIIAAGLIISQSTGLTDFSPISGMAIVAVTLILLLSKGSVLVAITMGTATCVASAQCADIMHDLKTGHLVGNRPRSQILGQLFTSWLGAPVCILVMLLLLRTFGLGEGSPISAPQARAMEGAVKSILGGHVPYGRYAAGIVMGSLLSLSGITSLGVLVGLGLILPFDYIIPYGVGCLLSIASRRTFGPAWTEEKGISFAAGILLGDAVVTLAIALFTVFGIVPG